jgi:hypothetical protein
MGCGTIVSYISTLRRYRMKLYEQDYLKSPFLEEELEYEEVQKKNIVS